MISALWIKDDNRVKEVFDYFKVSSAIYFDKNTRYFVELKDNNETIGLGYMTLEQSDFVIRNITVAHSRRNEGFGDLLIRMFIRKCFELGYSQIYANVPKSVSRFYCKYNFKILEEYDENVKMACCNDIDCKCRLKKPPIKN